jgi:hypothetical protein
VRIRGSFYINFARYIVGGHHRGLPYHQIPISKEAKEVVILYFVLAMFDVSFCIYGCRVGTSSIRPGSRRSFESPSSKADMELCNSD